MIENFLLFYLGEIETFRPILTKFLQKISTISTILSFRICVLFDFFLFETLAILKVAKGQLGHAVSACVYRNAVRFQNSNRSAKLQKCCDTIFSSENLTVCVRNNQNHFKNNKYFFSNFKTTQLFWVKRFDQQLMLGNVARSLENARFGAMWNDFVRNFSNCSKRVALQF